MKFGIALGNFTEGTNTVFTFCDFSHLFNQLTDLTEYQNWERYFVIAGRIGGTFISDFWTELDCINEGMEGNLGYDVGLCVGHIASMWMDTLL